MRVMLPLAKDRISPLLDVARRFLLVDLEGGRVQQRRLCRVEPFDLPARVRRIRELGPQALICGAVSWPLEQMLTSAGVQVIPDTRGQVDEVLTAFVAGDLADRLFSMPGCSGEGRRRRRRQRGGHHRRPSKGG